MKIELDIRESDYTKGIMVVFFKDIDIKKLDVGDVIVDDQVCFELKQPDDFIASIYDGRLFSQIEKMKMNYERSYIVISGSITDIISTPGTNYNSLMGAITSCFARGCPIIFCDNYETLCDIIKKLSLKLVDGKDRSPQTIKLPIKDDSLRLVCSFPGISEKKAQALLDHFGSPIAIFNAYREDMTEVNGIGDKIFDKMTKVLHGNL